VSGVQVSEARGLLGRRAFVDVPFRIHENDQDWIPPLRLSVYDRLSPRHPAMAHQQVSLWIAYRDRRPVGRIGACIDSAFNDYQGVRWAWVGFFEAFDDRQATAALFDVACGWAAARGADTCVGPASFTTNDEPLGLLVEGFDDPPTLLSTQNPPYYERLWVGAGWKQTTDLWAWELGRTTTLSERQRRTLDRIRQRAKVRLRRIDMADFDAEVGRFFEVYKSAWSRNWGFAPIAETEIRHVAKQLRRVINPDWAIGLETPEGQLVAFCIALPDLNQVMAQIRSGRLLPFGWYRLLTGRRKVDRARIWLLGIRPDHQHLALGPLLYREITDRLTARPHMRSAEASWILATNSRMNDQIEALGGCRTKVWRLYERPAERR
jgi:ribosomal protein S18 acetylase RimI-like enzyme